MDPTASLQLFATPATRCPTIPPKPHWSGNYAQDRHGTYRFQCTQNAGHTGPCHLQWTPQTTTEVTQ